MVAEKRPETRQFGNDIQAEVQVLYEDLRGAETPRSDVQAMHHITLIV